MPPKFSRPRTARLDLAHVRDVEQAGLRPDRTCSWRTPSTGSHLPAGERHQACACPHVCVVQRGRLRSAGRGGHHAAPYKDGALVLFQKFGNADVVLADLELAAHAVSITTSRRPVPIRVGGASRPSKPVAITVTRTSSACLRRSPSRQMMLELSAAEVTISAASFTSNRPRSLPPVMFSRIPVAPSPTPPRGKRRRFLAASAARSHQWPRQFHQRRAGVAQIVRTSAKRGWIRPAPL